MIEVTNTRILTNPQTFVYDCFQGFNHKTSRKYVKQTF